MNATVPVNFSMTETPVAARRGLFAVTILAGSFLLFLIQPMVARMGLPRLGGAPNVWNSAMLVYQALLLGGYAYAHVISRLAIARQAVIQLALLLLAGLTLPVSLATLAPPAPGNEVWWVPWLFLLTIGPVFFVVSAQAPLMQRWFAAAPDAGDPYRLYAASNLGSFAGLLTYPLLAEPLLPIAVQSRAWALGYGLLIVLVAAAAWSRRGSDASVTTGSTIAATEASAAPGWRQIVLWLALSAVPSGLMLSTTTYLTTDIFAMPLLWVIPLGLYLLSFTIAFAARRGPAAAITLVAPVIVLAAGGIAMFAADVPSMVAGAASLVLLFVVAVALHTRLYAARPDPARLTQFYLVMSAGGVLGGVFTALLAPLLFDWTWEHPLLILAAAWLVPLDSWSGLLTRIGAFGGNSRITVALLLLIAELCALALRLEALLLRGWHWLPLLLLVMVVATGCLLAARRWAFVLVATFQLAALGGINHFQQTLAGVRERSYFGIYTVNDLPEGGRTLLHGTTLHGIQPTDAAHRYTPTTYYGPSSGAGIAMLAAERMYGKHARIGVVGLGVGTLACYHRPGQQHTFFEIDPTVLAYSRKGTFTYLSHCAPDARVEIGDARLNLAKAAPGSFDILAIDAFSSDSIPLHLLTAEAQAVYFRALAPEGMLLVHTTNRFVDLEPVVAALARRNGLSAAIRDDWPKDKWPQTRSFWIVLTRQPQTLARLQGEGHDWKPLAAPAGAIWTDDYASILPHMKWHAFF